MSGWEVGDLALAVRGYGSAARLNPSFGARPGHKLPRKGGVYTVEGVDYSGGLGLVLEGHHSKHFTRSWSAICFIKITPGADIEGVEERRRVPVREDA